VGVLWNHCCSGYLVSVMAIMSTCSGLTSYIAWPDFIRTFRPAIIDSILRSRLTLSENEPTLIDTGTDFIGLGPH